MVHFFTGFLLARALNYREHKFECFLMSMAGFLPDIDFIIGFFVPTFSHGVWTHTILIGYTAASLLALAAWFAFRSQQGGGTDQVRLLLRFIGLAILGVSSHLALDAWTFYESAADQVHHMYFWPVWNFPVHINTMFTEATYGVRVAVEVAYSAFVGVVVLLVQWAWRRQNPFKMFLPSNWVVPSNEQPPMQASVRVPLSIATFAVASYAILAMYIIMTLSN